MGPGAGPTARPAGGQAGAPAAAPTPPVWPAAPVPQPIAAPTVVPVAANLANLDAVADPLPQVEFVGARETVDNLTRTWNANQTARLRSNSIILQIKGTQGYEYVV